MQPPKTAQLSVIARLAGMSIDKVYERFRLPNAPPPQEVVACIPMYEIAEAIIYLQPGKNPT